MIGDIIISNRNSTGVAESATVVGTGNAYIVVSFDLKGIPVELTLTRAMLEQAREYDNAAILGAIAEQARNGHADILGNIKGATVELKVGKGSQEILEGKGGFTLDIASQKEASQARQQERRAKREAATAASPRVAA